MSDSNVMILSNEMNRASQILSNTCFSDFVLLKNYIFLDFFLFFLCAFANYNDNHWKSKSHNFKRLKFYLPATRHQPSTAKTFALVPAVNAPSSLSRTTSAKKYLTQFSHENVRRDNAATLFAQSPNCPLAISIPSLSFRIAIFRRSKSYAKLTTSSWRSEATQKIRRFSVGWLGVVGLRNSSEPIVLVIIRWWQLRAKWKSGINKRLIQTKYLTPNIDESNFLKIS